MSTLTSKLIVALVDRVTAPSRAIARTLRGLNDAQARNRASLEAAQSQMFGAAAVAYTLARAIGKPIAAAADFQSAMNKVQALSGSTGEQFGILRQQALELGRTTQFTASQAGDAMGFLAMAGFKADQIFGAMPGTLQLASAAQMDLASTADVVTNILTGYNMKATELGHVNDVLVKAFTSANTDLAQLGEAMKYVGPVAVSAGVAFEEATAALALMGNAGIQGSMAGTSLRGAITRILSPTKQVTEAMNSAGLKFTDAKGRLIPLVDIIKQLEPHADDTGLMMKLFGQRAGPAMAALVSQGSGALVELQEQLVNSGGTAQRVADVQMAGFNGKMKEFWSAVEGAQIAIGNTLLPALTSMMGAFTELLGPIAAAAEAHPRLTAAVIALTAGFVGLRVAAIVLKFAFLWMKGGVISAAIGGLTAMGGAVRVAGLAFGPFAAAARGARSAMVGFAAVTAIGGPAAGLRSLGASLLSLLNPMRLVTGAMRVLRLAVIGTGIGAVLVGIAAAGTWIYNNWSGISTMFEAFKGAFSRAIEPIMPAIQPVLDGFGWLWEAVSNLLGPIDEMGGSWAQAGINAGKFVGDLIVGMVELPGKVIAAVQAIVTSIGSLGAEMVAAGTQMAQGLWDGAKAKIDEMIAWFAGLPGRIIAAIGNIDIGSLIKWPTPPAWLSRLWGGGGATQATPPAAPAIAGTRAAGGPVRAGGTYLVGENGPELRTEGSSGYIHNAVKTAHMMRNAALASALAMSSPAAASAPQHQGASRGGGNVTVDRIEIAIQASPGQSAGDLAQEVKRALSAELNALSRGAYSDGAN